METPLAQPITSRKITTAKLPVVIVPGFHDSILTTQLLVSLPTFVQPIIVEAFPASPFAVYQWLQENLSIPTDKKSPSPPIVAVGFSAGVVGLSGGLAIWQQQGGRVSRLIAIDGWGVPVIGIPVTRMSHDRFTHVSSLPLSAGDKNFYADPPVAHTDLWGQPEAVRGWQVDRWNLQTGDGIAMTAAEFLRRSLHKEWNDAFNWRTESC